MADTEPTEPTGPPDSPEPFAGKGFATRAIHAGQPHDPTTGAVVTPIVLSSTFAQEAVGVHQGFEYSRSGNPTRQALERCVASLEGARHGLAFASGLAALDVVCRDLAPGDRVVLSNDAYGGTYRLLARIYGPLGVEVVIADLSDPTAVEAALNRPTAMVVMETPTNPVLRILDIETISALAHRSGATVVVDNTFATPYLQQPLALGADVVMHSSTKYLGGHSDVVGGFLATNDDACAERLAYLQNAAGAVPGPFDCYLVLRGVKTLAARMEQHCRNAAAVAEFLAGHPAVGEVFYPGRPSHPGHAVAARQMRGFGGMVSFTLKAGESAALAAVARTEIFTLAESLGAVESLIEHPGRMTHASVAGSALEVDPALIRLSVGIEDIDDLIADLRMALA